MGDFYSRSFQYVVNRSILYNKRTQVSPARSYAVLGIAHVYNCPQS